MFWDELGVRFNFVAVDYLVYTHEVVGNIWQSYPMPVILAGLAAVATFIFWLLRRAGWLDRWLASTDRFGQRLVAGSVLVALPLAGIAVVSQSDIPEFGGNNNNRELAKNGVFSFFAAWRAQELDYGALYRRVDDREALVRARRLMGSSRQAFRSEDPWDFVHRVENPGPERRFNVIQVTVESLSYFFVMTTSSHPPYTYPSDRIDIPSGSGRDVLTMRPAEGRAYVGNYQKPGLLRQRELAVLRPDGSAAFYGCDLWGEDLVRSEPSEPNLLEDTTAAYQAAYLLFSQGLLTEEVARCAG